MVARVLPLAEANSEDFIQEEFGAVRLFERRQDGQLQTALKIPTRAFRAAKTVAQALQLIQSEMQKLPATVVEGSDWQLSIPRGGGDGFGIDLTNSGDGIRCAFGELEEEFASLETAMMWVGRALGSDYQLRIVLAGGKPVEWYLEPVAGERSPRDVLAMGTATLLGRLNLTQTTVIQRNSFAPVRAAT